MIQGNFNHELQILSIQKSSDFDGFDDVVVSADWVLFSNHVDYPDTKMESYGQSFFNVKQETVGIGSEFVSFEDLTEEIIVNWIIQNKDHCNNMKRQHQAMLTKEYLFPKSNSSNLPWTN